ncbi:MAG: serine/threonine-protein kinase [Nanoarchaeota archaeon]|nr:serine/threonine-protein kinase [Nanoarchaeota archaeon]
MGEETNLSKRDTVPIEHLPRDAATSTTPTSRMYHFDSSPTYPVGSDIPVNVWDMYSVVRDFLGQRTIPITFPPNPEKGILGVGGHALVMKGATAYHNEDYDLRLADSPPFVETEFAYKIPFFEIMNTKKPEHNGNMVKRLQREDKIACAVRDYLFKRHPGFEKHVVRAYDLGMHGPVKAKYHEKNTPTPVEKDVIIWFGQHELVEGQTLSELVSKVEGGLPLKTILDHMIRICKVLEVAHEENYFHRDIKPSNILVTKQGVVKLGDFGLARRIGDFGPSLDIRYSPGYAAPEQVTARNGGPPIDHRVDIYSLGASLYELLTGQKPYYSVAEFYYERDNDKPVNLDEASIPQGDTKSFMIHPDAQPAHEIDPSIPEGISEIIAHCIKPKRDDRFSSMKEIGDLLEIEQQRLS